MLYVLLKLDEKNMAILLGLILVIGANTVAGQGGKLLVIYPFGAQ